MTTTAPRFDLRRAVAQALADLNRRDPLAEAAAQRARQREAFRTDRRRLRQGSVVLRRSR